MVSACSHKIPRVSCYSGYCYANLSFIYRTFTLYGMIFQTLLLDLLDQFCSPNPKSITTLGLGSSYFARHYFRNRFYFLFLWVLRCFSSPRSPLTYYFTHMQIHSFFSLCEFPHSDICGSMDICSLPQLFAAYHVLLRLMVPRHSPYALCSLTSSLSSIFKF